LGLRERIALIADTNFLMMVPQGLVTPTLILEALESSYRILVPTSVIEELRMLAEKAPAVKARRLASRTLHILERGLIDYEVVEAEGPADDAIVLLAEKLKAMGVPVIVATNDRSLRRRLRMIGVPTLYYRESSSKLEVDWLQP